VYYSYSHASACDADISARLVIARKIDFIYIILSLISYI